MNQLSNNNTLNINRAPPQKNRLYYSNGCSHSKTFITQLKRNQGLYDSFEFINIDTRQNRINLPKYVTSVPTIDIQGMNRPLSGESAFFWLQTECNRGSGSRNTPQPQQPGSGPQPSGDSSGPGGIVGLDDSVFSTIDGNQSMSDGFWSYLDGDAKITNSGIQSESMSKSDKISPTDLERYKAQRDEGIIQPHRRM